MDSNERQAVATLAAAIVVARNATDVAQIRDAWTDAKHIISPNPINSCYKAWQKEHQETPTTPEEDAAAIATKQRDAAARLSKLRRTL